jgi:hypothetical protein
MTPDETWRFRKAMFVLEELSMYANTHDVPFMEGKFLNVFGKCASDMVQLFDLFYHPLSKNRHALKMSETTSLRANRAIVHVLNEMNKTLHPEVKP